MGTVVADNKMLVQRMLSGEINWLEQWANDGVWIIPGTSRWSGTYRGKAAIGKELLAPLTAEMASLGKFEIDNIIAEGNYVIVQGHATERMTKSGRPYNNTYCLVYEIEAGKIRQLTEYCDTELIANVFGDVSANITPS